MCRIIGERISKRDCTLKTKMKKDLIKKWNVCEVRISFVQAAGIDC